MSECLREDRGSEEGRTESWRATKPEDKEKGGKRTKASFALEFLAVALPMEKESKILNIKL